MAGLSITPAFVRVDKALVGTRYIIPVSVVNQSAKKTEYFKAAVETVGDMVNGTPSATVLGWANVKPKTFTLGPGETRKVKVAIKIPKGYSGDYRVMLAIKQDPRKYKLKLNKKKLKQSIGVMQFGKTSTRIPEFKTHVKALVKINIPIVMRALKKGQKVETKLKKFKLGKFSIDAALDKRNAMTFAIPVKNTHRFDTMVAGSCTILDAKGLKKLKVVGVNKRVNMQPATVGTIRCDFRSALPKGKYQVRGNFQAAIKGTTQAVALQTRQNIKISTRMAKKMSDQGDSTVDDRPLTPLMVAPAIIEQESSQGSIRTENLEIVNPTSKKLKVFAKFKSSNKSKAKVKISPKKFVLKPGETKRIKVDFKQKNKKHPIYGWLAFTTKQTKGSIPIKIPVMIAPDNAKLKQKLKLGKVSAVLSAEDTWLGFSTKMKNSKKGRPALFLVSRFDFTDVNAGGKKISTTVGRFSNSTSLPGDVVKLTSGIDFSKLKDGVYKISIGVSSEEGGVELHKTVRVVVNREIDQKIKVINQ
jgi:hypothetical protein